MNWAIYKKCNKSCSDWFILGRPTSSSIKKLTSIINMLTKRRKIIILLTVHKMQLETLFPHDSWQCHTNTETHKILLWTILHQQILQWEEINF